MTYQWLWLSSNYLLFTTPKNLLLNLLLAEARRQEGKIAHWMFQWDKVKQRLFKEFLEQVAKCWDCIHTG